MTFNPLKLQEMMVQAQKQAQDLQVRMQNTFFEASAGGGTVTVKINGQKALVGIKIEPDAVQSGDIEMLQDLITAAVNEAGRKADQAMKESLGGMIGSMGLPGIS